MHLAACSHFIRLFYFLAVILPPGPVVGRVDRTWQVKKGGNEYSGGKVNSGIGAALGALASGGGGVKWMIAGALLELVIVLAGVGFGASGVNE